MGGYAMSVKGDTNKKWVSTEDFRSNYDRTFKRCDIDYVETHNQWSDSTSEIQTSFHTNNEIPLPIATILKLAAYEEALRFYASKEQWVRTKFEEPKIIKDMGTRAKNALAKWGVSV